MTPKYSYPIDIGTYTLGRVVCDVNPVFDQRVGHITGFGLSAAGEITIEVRWAGSSVSYVHPESLEFL